MLVGTNVPLRTLQPHHPFYAVADASIRLLPARGRELYIVPQNLVELWVVATRPFGVDVIHPGDVVASTVPKS
jgi:hypothetical protein